MRKADGGLSLGSGFVYFCLTEGRTRMIGNSEKREGQRVPGWSLRWRFLQRSGAVFPLLKRFSRSFF